MTGKPNPGPSSTRAKMLREKCPCLVLVKISTWCEPSRKTTPAGSAGDSGRLHAHREERAATELGLPQKQNQKAKSERKGV